MRPENSRSVIGVPKSFSGNHNKIKNKISTKKLIIFFRVWNKKDSGEVMLHVVLVSGARAVVFKKNKVFDNRHIPENLSRISPETLELHWGEMIHRAQSSGIS